VSLNDRQTNVVRPNVLRDLSTPNTLRSMRAQPVAPGRWTQQPQTVMPSSRGLSLRTIVGVIVGLLVIAAIASGRT